MPRILARKDPSAFKTQPLYVEANAQCLVYQPLGQLLSFRQMLERRRPLQIDDPRNFTCELANLGVSVRLTLTWCGRDYWLLVRQQRRDRGDCVLKLISGYVPSHELHLPLHTALQEVAEECLLETPRGWLGGRFGEHWLPTPHDASLPHHEQHHYRLSPLCGDSRRVHAGSLPLLERPQAYVHLPTASLQLVYDLRLELPEELKTPSLFHSDETLEDGVLLSRLDRHHPDLFLLPVDGSGSELFILQKGELRSTPTDGLWLSESFAAQDGWLIRDDRIAWSDWVDQQERGEVPMARRMIREDTPA